MRSRKLPHNRVVMKAQRLLIRLEEKLVVKMMREFDDTETQACRKLVKNLHTVLKL